MPPKSNVPIRICGSKTRTGCRTCKQRHIKCDERRPVCLRCQKSGRQCTYERSSPPTSGSDQEPESSTMVVAPPRAHTHSPALIQDVSLYGSHEATEVGAVKNFAAYVGRDLAGCFSDDVWCRVLPRAAQYEPSIWHAAVAVGMLDVNSRLDHDQHSGESRVAVAVKHHIKAIQELNARLESNRKDMHCRDVVLLACVLFTVFECLQSQYPAALRHIRGGLKLLVAWTLDAQADNTVDTGSYVSYTSLQPIFLALDSQAVQMGVVDFQESASLPTMYDGLQVSTVFSEFEEAHLWLNRILNRLSRWAHWNDPTTVQETSKPTAEWILAERHKLETQLISWDNTFDVPLKRADSSPPSLLLHVQRTIIQLLFEKELGGLSEMVWDRHLALFQEAVQYAEVYMGVSRRSPQARAAASVTGQQVPTPSRPVFTVAMDIVMSLYLISAKCRDAQTRRRGLKMLKSCGRREGIWDSSSCAKIAEKIMEFEEAAAFEDGFIPESARIFQLDVRLGDNGTSDITYMRLVPNEKGIYHIEKFEGSFGR